MNNKNTKSKLNTEEMIIRGMKMNIENKVIPSTVKPKNHATNKISGPCLDMDTKDKIFHNKHIVSDKLQHLVALGYVKKNRAEGKANFERMYKFGDVKSKWENMKRSEKM